MINLVTAIGNTYINEKIKNIKNYNIIFKDIQYPEGILEILNINKKIDILLISTTVLGEKEFIEKIQEEFEYLEIILFIDNNFQTDIAYFNSKGIYKIYENNSDGYEEYLRSLSFVQNNITEQVRNEMKDFKKTILEKQNIKHSKRETSKKINKKMEKNNFLINKKQEKLYFSQSVFPKILTISGARGVGKSVFLSIFAKYIEKQNKSVLIIDACEENFTIKYIFGKTIKENFQKISKNINYISYENINMQNDYLNFKKIIEEKRMEFDCILIDINFENNLEFYRNMISISNNILFLVEPNLTELQKSKRILEVYEYDFEIPNEKIKIIFNKVNEFQISEYVLKEIFEEYTILEYVKYRPEYALYINKNTKYLVEDNAYEIIYKKIFE